MRFGSREGAAVGAGLAGRAATSAESAARRRRTPLSDELQSRDLLEVPRVVRSGRGLG
jgi:hypothetical protein